MQNSRGITMSSYRFSFDLGTNSIGWAVFELDPKTRPVALADCGVRIFPDGRNPKDKQSLAVARREARAVRRRRDRYLKRRSELMERLVAKGLMPESRDDQKALEGLDPYALRAAGLDDALPPHHFGRALFHLNQRRGFKSNRKTDRGENSETGITKIGMKKLHEALLSEGCRTLGELQHRHHEANQTPAMDTNPKSVRSKLRGEGAKAVYDFYPSRDAVEDEFNKLWDSQKRFHPDLLTDSARDAIRDAIFYQRKLKTPDAGRCSFNPAEERVARAMPIAQHFRILQFVGDLRLIDNDLVRHPLNNDQKKALYRDLLAKGKLTFKAMRKTIGIGSEYAFSHESEKQSEFRGDETAARLAGPKYFGPKWRELSFNDQSEIVDRLLHEENEETLIQYLQDRFGFDHDRCEVIADAPLPDGHTRLGKTALETLVEIMRDAAGQLADRFHFLGLAEGLLG